MSIFVKTREDSPLCGGWKVFVCKPQVTKLFFIDFVSCWLPTDYMQLGKLIGIISFNTIILKHEKVNLQMQNGNAILVDDINVNNFIFI